MSAIEVGKLHFTKMGWFQYVSRGDRVALCEWPSQRLLPTELGWIPELPTEAEWRDRLALAIRMLEADENPAAGGK